MGKKRAYEMAYEQIKQKITDGVWRKGDRIDSIKQLAEEMYVGVSSVREAIRIFVKQNILIPEQGRGTFVANTAFPDEANDDAWFGSATMVQLTETRLLIEPELSALAAVHASPEELELITAAAAEMERKVKRGEDFFKSDMDFHNYVAKASKNAVLFKMMDQISGLLRESRRSTMRSKEMNRKAAIFHTLIAESIAIHDAEQARTLMKAHIHDVLLYMKSIQAEA